MTVPVGYIVRNLLKRRLTTVLTAGGMALVVYVFATVLMLAAGLEATLVASGQDDNVVVIRRGAQTEVQSGVPRDQAAVVESMMPTIWRELIEPDDFEATTWNVNFPYAQAANTTIVHARLGLSYYQGCFKKRGDQYHHALATAQLDTHPDTDDVVLQAGHVSATRIDIRSLGQQ